jgi:4'-phosphopantetheinyl transferase
MRPREVHVWTGAPAPAEILRRYLGAEPAIVTGPHGKPRLAGDPLFFNLSHSSPHRVLAVAPREVGVDVEVVRDRGDVRVLAEIGLPEADAGRVEAAPPHERSALFHRLWVRHEARLKCHGVGLVAPLPPDAADAVIDLDLGPGVAGALALQLSARASAAWPPPITGSQWEVRMCSTGSTSSGWSAARSSSTVPASSHV